MELSELIDQAINKSIEKFNNERVVLSPFNELVSMSELIDRLSIINIKLFNLKDNVAKSEDVGFKAWAAEEDIRLVEERARLKKCIDSKLTVMLSKIANGDTTAGINAEMKRYGDKYG